MGKLKHGRGAIRNAIKEDYARLKNYRHVGSFWNLSGGVVWKFENQKNYYPKTKEIKDILKREGKKRGIVVGVRPLPK